MAAHPARDRASDSANATRATTLLAVVANGIAYRAVRSARRQRVNETVEQHIRLDGLVYLRKVASVGDDLDSCRWDESMEHVQI